jgi:hypothetical protein
MHPERTAIACAIDNRLCGMACYGVRHVWLEIKRKIANRLAMRAISSQLETDGYTEKNMATELTGGLGLQGKTIWQ